MMGGCLRGGRFEADEPADVDGAPRRDDRDLRRLRFAEAAFPSADGLGADGEQRGEVRLLEPGAPASEADAVTDGQGGESVEIVHQTTNISRGDDRRQVDDPREPLATFTARVVRFPLMAEMTATGTGRTQDRTALPAAS